MKESGGQAKNPFGPCWTELSQLETTRFWDSNDVPSSSSISTGRLCSRMFSQEYIECGDEEDLSFQLMRPLHSQHMRSQVSRNQIALLKKPSSRIIGVPVGGKVTLVAEACPTLEHHEALSNEYSQLMKRVTEVKVVAMEDEVQGESSAPIDKIIKETISFEYRACMCKISVSTSTQNLGDCHLGESYKVPITVANMSELTIVLRPVIQSSGCEVYLTEVKLAGLEKKTVTVRLVPTIETERFVATVRFRSLVGNVEGDIEITGKSSNAMALKFHNLFYQLSGKVMKNNHQLHFGRAICNTNNYSNVRLKNTSRIPIKLEMWVSKQLRLRMAASTVESRNASQSGTVIEKVPSYDEGAADLMRSDIEELKWGLSNQDAVRTESLRVPLLGKPDGKATKSISSSVEALDITPLPSKRNEFSRRYGSLGNERGLLEKYSELHHLASFQDIVSVISDVPKDKEAPPRPSNRSESSITEFIDTMKSFVIPWLFRELDTDKLASDIDQIDLAAFANFSIQDLLRPFLPQSDSDDQEKAQIAQEILQKMEMWFAKNHTKSVNNGFAEEEEEGPLKGSVKVIELTLQPSEERDIIFELWPAFQDESDVDGKLFNGSITIRMCQLDQQAMQSVLADAFQEDADLERLLSSDPTSLSRLLTQRIPFHYQAFCAELAVVPRSINFGKTIVGDSVVRYLRIVNKSPLYCPYHIEKSGSIASGFLSVTGGRKGIVPPVSSINVEVKLKPTMPFIFEEDFKIRNVINAVNDQRVPMKSKVLRADTFSIVFNENAQAKDTDVENNELSMENMIDQENREAFSNLLSLICGEKGVPSEVQPGLLYKYMGSSAVGKNPTVEVRFTLRNMTSRTRQFIVDSTSNDAVELLDWSQLPLRDASEEVAGSITQAMQSLIAHPHNFAPIPEVLQNVLCMRCHFSSRLEKQQKAAISQNTEEDENVQLLLDQLEKMQQKLKIAIRKNKAEKILKYRKKVEDCIQQLASKASTKPVEPPQNKAKRKADVAGSSTITEDTELAHFIELAPEEEVHIEMRISYLPSAQYRAWKGLLPFIGRVRIFEVKHEDIKKTIVFGTLLYSSTIEMTSPHDTMRSRLNSFESDVTSDTAFDRKLSLMNIKEAPSMNAPFLITVPIHCSMMTKNVYPKYKKLAINTVGGCVKLTRSRKDKSMSGTFSITSFHSKFGQLEFLIDEKFIPMQIASDSKTGEMQQYGSILMRVHEAPVSTHFPPSEQAKDGSGEAAVTFHDLSANRFVVPLSQRARKTFVLRWSPPQFVEPPSDEFKLIGAVKITYGASDNTYYSSLLPFVCAYQHKSNIDVDKYCSFGDVSIGSYSTMLFNVKNTSDTEELHYIVTLEASDLQTAKGFVEVINGKSGVIPANSSKSVTVMFNATSLGRFAQKLWVQNIKDGFDQRRIVAQANVIVSPARFVVFPDLEPLEPTGKRQEIDFGLVETVEDEQIFCDCDFEALMVDPNNGLYELKIKNVSTSRLSVTAVSNLRKQCFIYADRDGTAPAVNVLLPKNQESSLFVFLRPTKLVDMTSTSTKDNSAVDIQREVRGGIRLVFFTAEADTPAPSSNASVGDATVSVSEDVLVHRKLFETALLFKATVGKSVAKAFFVTDDIHTVRNNNTGTDETAVEINRIPLKIRDDSQSFPLRYWICTCMRSSYSGHAGFSILDEEDRHGSLKPQTEMMTSVAVKMQDIVGITYKHLRVHNLGANTSTEVCKMLHFPGSEVVSKLVVQSEGLVSYVRVRGNPSASDEKDREVSVTCLQSSLLLPCSVIVENKSDQPFVLYPVSNLPVVLGSPDIMPSSNQLSSSTIDFAALDTKAPLPIIEELVSNYNRNLVLQALVAPPYRLGNFQLCGGAFVLCPGEVASFAMEVQREYKSDWFLINDIKRLVQGLSLDLVGFLGFMKLDIETAFVDDLPVFSVITPEISRFQDNSCLALYGGVKLPLKIVSPRLHLRPREVQLGKIAVADTVINTEIELTNRSSTEILCILEPSLPWLTEAFCTLALEDGTSLEGERLQGLCDNKLFFFYFSGSSTVKLLLKVDSKQLQQDTVLQVHSYIRTATGLLRTGLTDLSTVEEFRVNSQKVRVTFESEVAMPLRGFSLAPADSKVVMHSVSTAVAVEGKENVASIPASPLKHAMLCVDNLYVPKIPTKDAIAFKEKSGLMTRKTVKMVVKNLSRRIVTISTSFSTAERFKGLVELDASFSNNDSSSISPVEIDESSQLKLRVGIVTNFKVTKKLLEGMKAFPLVTNLSWNEQCSIFAQNKPEDSFLLSADKRRLILKAGQGVVTLVSGMEHERANTVFSYSELVDVFVTIALEQTLLPLFDATLSLLAPVKAKTDDDVGDEESIHFLFCGSLEGGNDPASANDDNVTLAENGAVSGGDLTNNTTSLVQSTHWCNLLEQEQTFFLHNITTTPMKFRLKSESIRCPGLRVIFPQDSFQGQRPPMEIWTDTFRVCFEPENGELAPGGMLQIRLSFVPGSPSTARCVTAPVVSKVSPDSTSATMSTTGNGSTNSNGSAVGSATTANSGDSTSSSFMFKSFTITCEASDLEDSTHPSVKMAATLIIDRAIQLLKSQPISETSRHKQQLNFVLADEVPSTAAVSTSSAAPVSLAAGPLSPLLLPVNSDEMSFGAINGSGSGKAGGASGASSGSSLYQSSDSLLLQPLSSFPKRDEVTLRKRGITPHPSSPYHGFIDLGKQVRRSEALEWMVTLENRSSEYNLCYSLHALSNPSTENWLIFGQNGGIVDKMTSSTFILYFVRSNIGKFVSYLLIRDMHQRDRDHIICITMEVISDQRRQSNTSSQSSLTSSEYLDLGKQTHTDLWMQRFADISLTSAVAMEGNLTSSKKRLSLRDDSAPNRIASARGGDIAITTATSLLRVKNMTDIVLEFYFTCPAYLTLSPADMASYQRGVEGGRDIFRILPNEAIIMKIVADEAWLMSQEDAMTTVIGDPSSVPGALSVDHPSSMSLSPLRSLASSPPPSPLKDVVMAASPMPSYSGNGTNGPTASPGTPTPPLMARSTTPAVRDVVTCHCTLFDNLCVQFPILITSEQS